MGPMGSVESMGWEGMGSVGTMGWDENDGMGWDQWHQMEWYQWDGMRWDSWHREGKESKLSLRVGITMGTIQPLPECCTGHSHSIFGMNS